MCARISKTSDSPNSRSAAPLPILLLEDRETNIKTVERAIQQTGFKPLLQVVRKGEEAIAALSAALASEGRLPIPRILLASLKVAEKNDFQLLRWLRQQPALKRMIVVMMAENRQPPGFRLASELGAVTYLVRPVGREELGALLEAVLDLGPLALPASGP